jgi:hypothetical protein
MGWRHACAQKEVIFVSLGYWLVATILASWPIEAWQVLTSLRRSSLAVLLTLASIRYCVAGRINSADKELG